MDAVPEEKRARRSERPEGLTSGFAGLVSRGRFSSLTKRILTFNVLGLILLVSGILYLNQFREGLIDARRQSLLTQAEIIAGALAESATERPSTVVGPYGDQTVAPNIVPALPWDLPIDAQNAAPILRRLVLPTRTRAQLFGKEGELVLDSRNLSTSDQIVTFVLPPPDWQTEESWLAHASSWVMRWLPSRGLEPFQEIGAENGRIYQEVDLALRGIASSQERVNRNGELIVSVAVPIQRYRAVLGALMLSTRGGDIDEIVWAEQLAIVQVFLIALAVSILLSLLLAGTIAEPVRRLAEAADLVRRGPTNRTPIPDFTSRRDEIGDLSGSLRDMTNALYQRIDAIESFAADVAHELKNPLTSLRSAIETFEIAKDEETRARLLAIIHDDIRRIDRLISDIASASRLDAELGRETLAPINLGAVVSSVAAVTQETHAGNGQRIRVRFYPDESARNAMIVRGSEQRLGQVLRNLLENALSFSPANGEVVISAFVERDDVRVLVEDRGPGIPDDNLEKIFERFHTYRPDDFGKHSGLGLAISKQIVEAHGGTIHAENRGGGGARFVVELPRQ